MSWLALIIVGVILWAIGHYAPLPAPLGTILVVIGIVMLVVGVILLLVGLLGGATALHVSMPALL